MTVPDVTASAPDDQAASGQRRWWALGALALSVLVVGLDVFVLTLAIPTLSVDLHASSSDTQWFLDAYSLVLAAALLPAGLLGDRYGRKKLLFVALILFGISSLACAYSTSTAELITARVALGLAAAVITPLSLAVLPVMFKPEERPKAIAIVGGATFLGFPLGPILGGWLLDHFWWGSVFLINVPIVLVALAAVAFLMPESRSRQRPRIDVVGVVLSSAALTALTYGFIVASTDGWSSATTLGTIAAGLVGGAGFVAWEQFVTRRGRQPLVDLGLFRSAGFTWGTILSTMISFALFGVFFVMPQYFLDVRGLNSLDSGVRMLPLIGGLIVGLGLGQRLQSVKPGAQARGPLASAKIIGAVGFAIMAAAMAIGTATSTGSATGFMAAWFALTGFGLGLAMPTMLNAALSALTPERSGSGSALMSAMRQVGATIGVAVLGTVIATVYQSRLRLPGLPASAVAEARGDVAYGVKIASSAPAADVSRLLHAVGQAYTGGLDVMLWICAGIAIAAAVLCALFIPRNATGSAAPSPEAAAAIGAADTVAAGIGPAEVATAEVATAEVATAEVATAGIEAGAAGVAGRLADGTGGE
jgi:MFS transporter, DHA2 family, multidrug resistance protein